MSVRLESRFYFWVLNRTLRFDVFGSRGCELRFIACSRSRRLPWYFKAFVRRRVFKIGRRFFKKHDFGENDFRSRFSSLVEPNLSLVRTDIC